MTVEVGRNGHRNPRAVTSGNGNRQARTVRAPGQNPGAWLMIGLGMLLRDRAFQAKVITGVIGAAALASLAREGQTRNLARLAVWDSKQSLREQRKAAARR